jgi:glutathione S-transferase
MLKLYYAPGTCALASHIALIDAGATFEAVRLDFAKQQQQSAQYLAINPKGRVPALVTEQGVITETPAILAYIAQDFPLARLATIDNPFAFARVQAFNSYLCATCHVAHAHLRRGARWVDASETAAIEAMQRRVPSSVTQCFELIEHGMLQGPWVMGKDYTICDPYLYTLSMWLDGDKADLSKLPRVLEHRQRMAERPSAKQALAEQTRQLETAA